MIVSNYVWHGASLIVFYVYIHKKIINLVIRKVEMFFFLSNIIELVYLRYEKVEEE